MKANKKKNIILIIILLIILFMFVLLKINESGSFKIESRVNNIKNNTKSDKYDTIGWIRVQGTNIDYPVIVYKNQNNESESIELESFALSKGKKPKFYKQMTIIGHNIFNLGSVPKKESKMFERFESLMSFVYYDFAKENHYIQYTIDGKDYKYEIFAVSFIGEIDSIFNLRSSNISKKENKESIEFMRKESIYDYNTRVNENDNIIHLVTCTRMFGINGKKNFVVSGKQVGKHYNIKHNIEKSSKYKDVEKKLNGGKENEEDL